MATGNTALTNEIEQDRKVIFETCERLGLPIEYATKSAEAWREILESEEESGDPK